jgi:GDP-L-fucose synthase
MSELSARRVLVTGGTGFIGQHVVRALSDAGATVTTTHPPEGPAVGELPAHVVELDLGSDDRIYAAAEGMDAVVHLAARSGGIQLQERDHAALLADNLRMSRQVFDACRRASVPRVFTASSAVVYRGGSAALNEEAPKLAPGAGALTGYAWSKLTEEALAGWATAAGTPVVIGRFANVYGPGGSFDPDRSTVLHALVRKAVEAAPEGRVPVWGDGSAVRSFVYVEDAARAVVAVLTAGEPAMAYNIDATEPITVGDAAAAVCAAVSPGLQPAFEPDRPSGPSHRVLDNRRLTGLGWRPGVSLREGLGRTVDDYRSRHGR